jgi:tripartite-type tricarboxylate transporter receptor subunit TctC
MAEAGMPGYDATFREVLFAPKGTPQAIMHRMNEEIGRILKRSKVREDLRANDLDPAPDSIAAMTRQIDSDAAKWLDVVRRIDLHD